MNLPYRSTNEAATSSFTYRPPGRKKLLWLLVLVTAWPLVMALVLALQEGKTTLGCVRDATGAGECRSTFDGLIAHREQRIPIASVRRARMVALSGKSTTYRVDVTGEGGDTLSMSFGTKRADAELAAQDIETLRTSHGEGNAGPFEKPFGWFFLVVPLFAIVGPIFILVTNSAQMGVYTFRIDHTARVMRVEHKIGPFKGATRIACDGVRAISVERRVTQGRGGSIVSSQLVIDRANGREPFTPWIPNASIDEIARALADDLRVPAA